MKGCNIVIKRGYAIGVGEVIYFFLRDKNKELHGIALYSTINKKFYRLRDL